MRSKQRAGRGGQMRERIAMEAARLIVEQGIRDYSLAKRKAAEKLRLGPGAKLPQNAEIERALHDYRRLFGGEQHSSQLRDLRERALAAMQFLARYDPCLVGPVLEGTADRYDPVTLHLFAETAEEVGMFLHDSNIPHELIEKRLRVTSDETRNYPGYAFLADGLRFELLVFPLDGRRQAPLSPIDGRPMRRASRARLAAVAAGAEP